MAYFSPYIDDAGLHIPTYIDTRDKMITDAKNIFGQDIFLGNDSQDYQWIVTVAEKIYDAMQAAQLAYNNRSPATAIKAALDGIVKINGIKRKSATNSTCTVTISGIAGTQINNGIVYDKGNLKWDLPSVVTIPDNGTGNGTVDVVATCEVAGPIVANPGDLIGIYNPTYGWNGVYNSNSAELGSNVETDSLLRQRQSNSTAQPSRTVLEGTSGAIAQLTDVTRSKVYENDTNKVDSRGLPPHSITCVVEGGSDLDIAQSIFMHKGIGCYTNGDIEVAIDSQGQTTSIRFYRPSYIDIDVTINIKSLSGYTTATTDNIKKYLQTYLNGLDIGVALTISALYGIALQAISDLKNPTFAITSITAGRHGNTQVNDEILINYNEVCRGNVNFITANVT